MSHGRLEAALRQALKGEVRFDNGARGGGATFSFQESDWPRIAPTASFGRIFWIALPFMVIAAASVLYFILP